jgi:DNA-binding CsgD family transcriptional regulator/tetratricopeptide (TPR) repeat protein
MSSEAEALPGPLRSVSSSPFVGRATELAELLALLPRSAREGRRVALLAGEPGAGKSRLVREFAGHAAANGILVLSGACDAVVRTPYGAFIEALERLIAMTGVGPLRAALGPGAGELQRLLPDLPTLLGSLPEPVAADPDTERHRLHTAVAELLGNVGLERPILLVVEDCHWADAPTLQLIRHLSRSAVSARMLLLATFRDGEAEVPRELAETLADLRRSDDVVRMRVAGLSEAEISELISRSAGVESESDPGLGELAAAIHGLTGGNAFLVCELWRALLETGIVEVGAGGPRVTRPLSELGTPESVGEVVSQRLERLDARTTDLLELAAVAGPEFELEPIRQAAGLAEPAFLLALEEAVASGMIEELPSQRLACRFTHELVRRALYDQLSRLRRAELHLRVGEALEDAAGASERGLPDLAHHFAAAAQLGGADRAIDYNLRAARVASAALAYGDAAARLQAAVEIGIADPERRADVLLELGSASHRAGHAAEALTAFGSAAEIARDLGGAVRLARAAVGYEEACWRPGLTNAAAVELLEEALEAVDEDGEDLRIDLLAGLARALSSIGDPERGAVVRENAIDLARRREDGAALAKVLVRSYWAQGVTPREEILAMLTEAKDLASLLGNAETQTEAMAWRVPTLVSLCDLGAARAEIAALREMAERTGQPFMNHVAEHYGSAIALCEGDLAAAEAMAERSRDWGLLLTGRDASGSYGIQMFGIRREQGRLAELAPAVRVLAAGKREGPWQPGLVAVLAELGMEDEARAELARIRAGGLDQFRSSLWLAALTYLTDACAALGDAEMAAVLYPELEPFAGGNVMIGHLVACYGAADRYLGMLAATVGESALAARHFERAMEVNREMGASAWLAHSAYEYGRFLGARGRGERERSEALLGEATSLAERLGMRGLLDKAGSPPARHEATPLPAGLSPREAQILGLVAAGLSNREIGAELSISEHTAANHIRAILRKTECANRTEAASFAHRHGLAPA